MRLILSAIVIASLGCQSSPTDPQSQTLRDLATIRYGQTAPVGGVRVSFTEIQDSRCPKSVVCAWAGDAAARLEVRNESIVLHTNPQAGPATGTLAGVTIELLGVAPEPATPEGVKKDDYVVTLRVGP